MVDLSWQMHLRILLRAQDFFKNKIKPACSVDGVLQELKNENNIKSYWKNLKKKKIIIMVMIKKVG